MSQHEDCPSPNVPRRGTMKIRTFYPLIRVPVTLLNWLEMLRLQPENFLGLGYLLGDATQALNQYDASKFPDLTTEEMGEWLKSTRLICKKFELALSAKCIGEVLSDMETCPVDSIAFKTKLECLFQLIMNEMEAELYLCVPKKKDRAKLYLSSTKSIVGSQCCTRFKSIKRDLEESAKCFALGRCTASVFHLMRVLEICLHAAEDSLKLPRLKDPNWGVCLARWHAHAIPKLSQSHPVYTAHEAFYKSVRATLCAVKDAWRNPTMHVERDYNETESRDIFTAVCVFARNLAEEIDENGNFC